MIHQSSLWLEAEVEVGEAEDQGFYRFQKVRQVKNSYGRVERLYEALQSSEVKSSETLTKETKDVWVEVFLDMEMSH